MVLPLLIIGFVALVSAIIGAIIVYADCRRREGERRGLWTSLTAVGFLFDILPGLVVISVYFITSRHF